MNRLELSGTLVERGALRYTPAGIATLELKVRHESEQDEAGGRRKVEAEVPAVAFEAQARLLAGAALGSELRLKGFMSARSRRSKKLVLHVTDIEFMEGDANAAAAQRQ